LIFEQTVIAVGVRLDNFGSFTFLFAVASRGDKNGNVPKCAVGGVVKFGLRLHKTFIL